MKRIPLVCALLSIALACSSQQQVPDTAFLAIARQNTLDLYQKALRAQARLYNGSKYLAPKHSFEQHPYFSSVDWIVGSVFYDGEYFQDVPLMYDLFNNALITEHYPSGQAIQLVYAKLERFSIDGHYFEKIENESVANSLPGSGFYDILYRGETKMVARRQKFLREEIEAASIETIYEQRNRYFILRNGVYFSVKSKSSALKLMGDKKQELKRFLRRKHLPFAQNRELLLKSLAEYYDSLK